MAVERMSPRCLRLALPLGALIWLLICGCWARVRAEDVCREGQVGYDISAGEYLYGENPGSNNFAVQIEGQGVVTWTVKRGCYVCWICLEDGNGARLLPAAPEGLAEGDVIVFGGGCQCPCERRTFVPLVVGG